MRAKLTRPTRWLLEAFLIVGIVITVQAWRTRGCRLRSGAAIRNHARKRPADQSCPLA